MRVQTRRDLVEARVEMPVAFRKQPRVAQRVPRSVDVMPQPGCPFAVHGPKERGPMGPRYGSVWAFLRRHGRGQAGVPVPALTQGQAVLQPETLHFRAFQVPGRQQHGLPAGDRERGWDFNGWR